MRSLLAATSLACAVAACGAVADGHARARHKTPAWTPHYSGHQTWVAAAAPRRRIKRAKSPRRSTSTVTARRELGRLKSEIRAMRRELDQFRERVGRLSGETPPPRVTSLAVYALMPVPDTRPSGLLGMLVLPEPVGPASAALPLPSMPPASGPDPTPLPSDRSRLAIGRHGNVDRRLLAVLHEASRYLPDGFTARIESGVRRGRGMHPRGLAADVRIIDERGRPTGWYQTPATFRLYERFAQAAKRAQVRMYAGSRFVWGGYFRNGGPGTYGFADLMHMQWGGPMAGGSWPIGALGINRTWLVRNGGQSIGMGESGEVASLKKRHAEARVARTTRR